MVTGPRLRQRQSSKLAEMSTRMELARFLIVAALSFTLFSLYAWIIGHRNPSVGTDTRAYMDLFSSFSLRPDLAQNYEFGFIAFMKWIYSYSQDPYAFLLSISFLINLLFYSAGLLIFGRSSLMTYTIILLLNPFYYGLNTNGLRQGIALGICMVFVGTFLRSRKNFPIYFFGLSAVISFHFPMIIAALSFLIRLRRSRALTIWFIALIVGAFASLFSGTLSNLFEATKYDAYFEADQAAFRTGLRLDFILFSTLPFTLYMLIPKSHLLEFKKMTFFLSAYSLINAVGMVINFLPFYSRVLLASWILLPFIFVFALNCLQKGGRFTAVRRLGVGVLIVLTSLLGIITIT